MSDENGKSDVQYRIEKRIRERIQKKNEYEEKNRTIPIGKTHFELDFYFYDKKNNKYLIGEIYAHRGKLKDGQKKKLAKDCLKLIAIEKHFNQQNTFEKQIICVDKKVEDYLKGDSWFAEVFDLFGITVKCEELETELNTEIEEAQNRQAKGNYLNETKLEKKAQTPNA